MVVVAAAVRVAGDLCSKLWTLDRPASPPIGERATFNRERIAHPKFVWVFHMTAGLTSGLLDVFCLNSGQKRTLFKS